LRASRRGICGTSSVYLHLFRGLDHELVHGAQDLLVRFNHACAVEVPANLAEHVALLCIERAHGEGVGIGLGASACNSQFFGGPHAKELVAANRHFQFVKASHSDFLTIDGR
jgi:hypothetical protein